VKRRLGVNEEIMKRHDTAPLFLFLLMVFSLFMPEGNAQAHPMGNFSINHYSGLEITPGEIRLRYILDFAEIPAFQEIQEIDADRNGAMSAIERERYLSKKIGMIATGLILNVNGTRRILTPVSHQMDFPPGAGGLPTMRLSILFKAERPFSEEGARQESVAALSYRDNNYPGRAGWKEMAAAGAGVDLIDSPLPTAGGELRAYPERAESPPQRLEVRFSFRRGMISPPKPSIPNRSVAGGNGFFQSDRFTALITGPPPSGWVGGFALLMAFGLGTLHALSPGHGKTVVAAYLVGSRGTAWHALFLGVVVTVSHTIGVFLLGIVTLYLSKYFLPERLYPWLGLFSGLTILTIGLSLFRKRWRLLRGHPLPEEDHRHAHPHDHPHSDHPHRHEPHTLSEGSLPHLLGLGITGGIIPCPSALVVLLSAIAFHQVLFGLFLIVAFSAGLAAMLVGIGMLMVYLREVIDRTERFGSVGRILSALSAAGVAMLGGIIALGAWLP
jgi:ABC-type nickel/cobalt efflux system permease component RcnA